MQTSRGSQTDWRSVARDTVAVDELPDFAALREAVAKVKAFLDNLGVGIPPNDLIITGITDYDDLWMFSWNNGWVLLDQPEFGYPGCSPLAVFKADGRLLQIPKSYGWVDGAFEESLARVREMWRDSLEI